MDIKPFALERYFAAYEFSVRHLLSCSDCEPLGLNELLAMAGPETRQAWDGLRLGYTETRGLPALREAVSATYETVGPDGVLVLAPAEGIFLHMQALLSPGDHVVCMHPGYQSLHEVARSLGCRVSFWEPDEAAGWAFDLSRLEGLLQPETRLVVVNLPHNPTGAVPERRDFEALADLLRERGTYLFSDEMYRWLEADGVDTLPAACDLYERAVSLGGLSKSLGAPGLRVGWLATRNRDLLARVEQLRDYTTICSSAPSEALGLMVLENREGILAAQRRRLARNVAAADAFVAGHADRMAWVRPRGGSIAFPRLCLGESASSVCDRLVRETGIMLLPSRVFGYGEDHVRFGLGREDFPAVLDLFGRWLRRQ